MHVQAVREGYTQTCNCYSGDSKEPVSIFIQSEKEPHDQICIL